MKTFYALKSFWWDGKNIDTSDPVKLSEMDAPGMLLRGAVTERSIWTSWRRLMRSPIRRLLSQMGVYHGK